MSEDHKPSISIAKAVLIGHLIVNGPALIIMAIVVALGIALGMLVSWIVPAIPFSGVILIFSFLALFTGGVLGWLWWSFMVPRWRRWALLGAAEWRRPGAPTKVGGRNWPRLAQGPGV